MSQSTYRPAQGSLFDPILNLTGRQFKKLDEGWAGHFYREIFPLLVELEELFAPLYSPLPNSRPSTPTHYILGMLVLKSLFRLTDEEVEERMNFSIDFQYALGTTSFAHQPVNQRSLNRFRAANALYTQETGIDLLKEFSGKLAERLKEAWIGPKRKRRMDSVMIDNSCRHLSRLQLAHVVTKNALFLLQEHQIDIPEELHHYIEDFDENNVTYHSTLPAKEKLEVAFRDACAARALIPSELQDQEEALLLNRFIDEQIILSDDGSFETVRDGKTLTSTTLNNPADPESTIRTKAGETHIGYVGNMAETVDEETGHKIIDSMDLQPNIYSDSQFARDEIAKMAEAGDTSTLVTDGAYSSVDNVNLAAKNGIELIGTAMTGKETPDLVAEFTIDEETETVTCPAGKEADKATHCEKDDSWNVSFMKDSKCADCPFAANGQCPLKNRKHVRSGRISQKMIQRAQLQRQTQTAEFGDNYRFRNGVEAIPSQLRRMQNIDHLPFRGLVRKKQGFVLAITAINVRRVLRYAKEGAKNGLDFCFQNLLTVIFVKTGTNSQSEGILV